MSYGYIISITLIEMCQLNTYNPIYSNHEKVNRDVIEMTRGMLDTPPQDKPHKHLHILNVCEHSCIMMMLVGSKVS